MKNRMLLTLLLCALCVIPTPCFSAEQSSQTQAASQATTAAGFKIPYAPDWQALAPADLTVENVRYDYGFNKAGALTPLQTPYMLIAVKRSGKQSQEQINKLRHSLKGRLVAKYNAIADETKVLADNYNFKKHRYSLTIQYIGKGLTTPNFTLVSVYFTEYGTITAYIHAGAEEKGLKLVGLRQLLDGFTILPEAVYK